MSGIIRKVVRSAKRRIRDGRRDGRTFALFSAAERLLTRYDYERVSVARLAKEGDCSVGAFYCRFRTKDSFLYFLISSSFRDAKDRMERDLGIASTQRVPTFALIRRIVEHVISRIGNDKMAGITRAATKLATVKPTVQEAVLEYRTAVMDRAVDLLAPRFTKHELSRKIREAVQIILATVADSALENSGPLRRGKFRTVTALTDVMASYLEFEGAPVARGDDPDEDGEPHESAEEPPDVADGDVVVYDAERRTYHGTIKGSSPQRRKRRRASPHRPQDEPQAARLQRVEPQSGKLNKAIGSATAARTRIRRIRLI